jgi:CBS domain-containing protein
MRRRNDRKEVLMKVQAVMTRDVRVVKEKGSLADAGCIMADFDCGVLPVMNDQGRLVGILTDRDICLSVAKKNQLPSRIPVGQAMSSKVVSCGPDDDIQVALRTMRSQQVRRLPVLGNDGSLVGILSMDDVVVNASATARAASPPEVTQGEAVSTLKAIYGSRPTRNPIIVP